MQAILEAEKTYTFTVDNQQIVFCSEIELFRHGAPHSGAWKALAKQTINSEKSTKTEIKKEEKKVAEAYKKFLLQEPAVEIAGQYPISWYQESPIRNGIRISNLQWEDKAYHDALRNPRLLTEFVIPVNYGATSDEQAENERMQAIRDENGNIIVLAAGNGSLSTVDVGNLTGASVVQEELRKSIVASGYLPETFMTIKKWSTVPLEILPILVAMGVHKSKSWGMLISQVSPDMLRIMALHREQFSAWQEFEKERDELREKAIILMLKFQKDPDGATLFNDYYNAGGTTHGLVTQNIDSIRKLRGAVSFLDIINAQIHDNTKVPTTYSPPTIQTPQGVVWADANTFPRLSQIYKNCISRGGYTKNIAEGYAHVLYRTHRGEDGNGIRGGMCCYIEYSNEKVRGNGKNRQLETWYIKQIKGYGNKQVAIEYKLEAQSIVNEMNENPKAYIKLFRNEIKKENIRNIKGEAPTCSVEALKQEMPKTNIWGDGISMPVLHSLDRNLQIKNSNKDLVIVKRMRSAAI